MSLSPPPSLASAWLKIDRKRPRDVLPPPQAGEGWGRGCGRAIDDTPWLIQKYGSPGESRDPFLSISLAQAWVPAFAGTAN